MIGFLKLPLFGPEESPVTAGRPVPGQRDPKTAGMQCKNCRQRHTANRRGYCTRCLARLEAIARKECA